MFDIDKYLDGISIGEVNPTEELLRHTKQRCEEAEANKKRRNVIARRVKKAALIALPAAALLAAGVFIGSRFFPVQSTQPAAVAYYTVDINPSLCVSVDESNTVTGLAGQNDDAEALMGSLNCIGEPMGEAVRQIISAAQTAGYFSEGQRYVLIGCFGADGSLAQGALGDLQAQLEAEFGDMIDLLIVSGTMEDKQMADALSVSAGLLKLSQLAEGVEVSEEDKVEDILNEVAQTNKANYCAPALTVSGDARNLKFAWDELDFAAMGYAGKVKYHIVSADTGAAIAGGTARTLGTVSFYTYGAQTTSLKLSLADCGLQPGESSYFSIYAEYGGTMVHGSAVYYTAPGAELAATPAPAPESSETSSQPAGHTVSGRVSGDNVILTWDPDTSSNLAGYKVVASRTNPTPSYPGDGYLKYITNASTTSISLYEGYGNLQGNTYYYFSVTYLYRDGSTIAGSAVRLKVPDKDDAPDGSDAPEEPSGDYAATAISGFVAADGTIHLSWDGLSHSELDGYKVMYSFTDSSPVYGEDGCSYVYWITDSSDTSCSFSNSDIGGTAGQTCYFSITALYSDHTVKKAGNAISLVLAGASAPEEPYVSTNISGGISGTTVSLSWDQVNHSQFDGYKVMYSFTNSTPVYGVSGDYKYWITEASNASCTLDITTLTGYTPGATCWFSISVLYDGHSVVKAGNSISVTAP